MGIIALSYLGVNSDKIEDWNGFATNKLGMQKVDSTSKSAFFRMDDQKQRFCVTGEVGDCLSYLGWEVKTKNDLNQALLTSSLLEKNIGNTEIISALSVIIDPENLGRIAGDFSPNSISSRNTILLDGDSIFVPKNSNVINVLGEVLNPTAFEFSKNLSISKAIENAGGFQQFADKKRVYVIKANGMVAKASRNIFTGNSSLEPGDTVVVPRKTVSVNPIAQALMPITQILSDLAFSAAAVDSLSN